MSIADVQARRFLPDVLTDTGRMVAEAETLPERSPTCVWVINSDLRLTDKETGQQFYAVVYALLTESEEEATAAGAALKRVHGV